MNLNGISKAVLLEFKGKTSQGRQAVNPQQLPREGKKKTLSLKLPWRSDNREGGEL